ncbi:unnamed protein product [Arctia plantaginis]|uniref:Uncharacterized protein n=1 Tax=Arctia plantaginis TaxID=874455 RepID=A0A8S1BR99_ARCPL|nr:unnamed protein product [Arctia plantaginis]
MHQQYGDTHNVAITTKTKKTRKARVEPIPKTKDRIQTRASTMADVLQEQNSTRYATHYSMADDQSLLNANQVLYPNMSHVPTTIPYSMPQQMTQPPTNSTTDMSRYYNTPRPPISRQSQRAQQMNTPVPVEYPSTKQTKEQSAQTDLNITEDEHKMLKLLRSKRIIELSQLKVIMERSKRYDQKPLEKIKEDEPEEETMIAKETYNQIIEYSNFSKCKMLNYMSYYVKLQEKTAIATQQQTQAIQYQAMFNQVMANQLLPQGLLQSNQQQPIDTPNIPQWYPEQKHQENMSPNDEFVNTRTPNQQQVPDAPLLNDGLQIQTLIGHRPTPPHRVPYISPHILQAAALCLNNNYNRYGMSEYFQNRPSKQPPWGA